MPKTRCLSCNRLIDSRQSRCAVCAKDVKDERNRQAAELGPCPQTGACHYCGDAAGVGGKGAFVWCHWPKRFVDGGRTVVPGHKVCNEGEARKNKR